MSRPVTDCALQEFIDIIIVSTQQKVGIIKGFNAIEMTLNGKPKLNMQSMHLVIYKPQWSIFSFIINEDWI